MSPDGHPEHDAFISFSEPSDTIWVRDEFVPKLRSEGVKVCVGYEFFRPGYSILAEMERAIQSSRYTVLVLTPDYLKDPWQGLESQLSAYLSLTTGAASVIPVKLKPNIEQDLPLRIRFAVPVDLSLETPIEKDFQFRRLIATLREQPLPHWEDARRQTSPTLASALLIDEITDLVKRAAGQGVSIYPELLPHVLRTLRMPGASGIYRDALGKWLRAKTLFAAPGILTLLEELLSDVASDANERSAIESLLITPPYNWISPWRSYQRPTTPALDAAVKGLGWHENPFGAEQAEFAHTLAELHVDPLDPLFSPGWQELKAPAPILLDNSPECGQTALIRTLFEYFQTNTRASSMPSAPKARLFPVLLDEKFVLKAESRADHLSNLSHAIAVALLDFLAFNSQVFWFTDLPYQRAIARLVSAELPSVNHIKTHLKDVGLGDPDLARSLARELNAASLGETAMDRNNESAVLRTIQDARLTGFEGYVILADISLRLPGTLTPQEFKRRLDVLAQLSVNLAQVGIFLKAAVASADDLHINPAASRLLGPWQEDRLIEMLQRRLRWASEDGSLRELFGLDRVSDPEAELVRAAHGSPKKLVCLGNKLLALFGEQGKLTSHSFQKVLRLPDPCRDALEPDSRGPGVTQRAELRQRLCRYFNEAELKLLCNDLEIDYESLPPGGKEDKAQALILKLERLNRLEDLITQCKLLRPKVSWDFNPAAWEPLY